ncbi:MAG: methionyl-tRNA formyltransferase [Acidobacteriota bacterium]
MRIVFWGNGNRGTSCLQALKNKGHHIEMVVAHPDQGKQWYGSVAQMASDYEIPVIKPEDPNSLDTEKFLSKLDPDIFVLAGYGKIIKSNIIDIPKIMCINLHGGKLPKYRGSSPLNWALINGEESFTLSVIRVDSGVDTGDILLERSFEIMNNDNIVKLHDTANEQFPNMLLETLSAIEYGTVRTVKQDRVEGSYYPLRFPDDGLILWDIYTAEQIHNRIRALTEPYPCAFTYYGGDKVRLVESEMYEMDFYGEPGRVYQTTDRGLLICALDRCLWIKRAIIEKSQQSLAEAIQRYDCLATVRRTVKNIIESGGISHES